MMDEVKKELKSIQERTAKLIEKKQEEAVKAEKKRAKETIDKAKSDALAAALETAK